MGSLITLNQLFSSQTILYHILPLARLSYQRAFRGAKAIALWSSITLAEIVSAFKPSFYPIFKAQHIALFQLSKEAFLAAGSATLEAGPCEPPQTSFVKRWHPTQRAAGCTAARGKLQTVAFSDYEHLESFSVDGPIPLPELKKKKKIALTPQEPKAQNSATESETDSVRRSRMKPSFYAVAVGKQRGIYSTWEQCKSQVNGYSGAIYKSFRTLAEARAFLDAHAEPLSGGASPSRSQGGEASPSSPSRRSARMKAVRADEVDVDDLDSSVNEGAEGRAGDGGGVVSLTAPAAQRARVESVPIEASALKGSSVVATIAPSGTSAAAPHTHAHHQVVYVDGACSHNGTAKARAGYGGYYGSLEDTRNFALPVPATEAQTNNRGELRAVIHGIVQGFVDAGAPPSALATSHAVAADWPASSLPRPLSRLVIHTDSRYVIDGLTRYSQRWVSNGFKLATKEPVVNQDLWKQLIHLRDRYNTCYAQQQHEAQVRRGSSPGGVSGTGRGGHAPPPKQFHTHNTLNDETEGIELRHVKGHSNNHGNEMADSLAVEGARKHGSTRFEKNF